jgi:hypothetical protein
MMTTTQTAGIGPHRPDKYRGLLVFDWLTPELDLAENATAEADRARYVEHPYTRTWTRPATNAERELLSHLGHTAQPADLATTVTFHTDTVRGRTWPALGV